MWPTTLLTSFSPFFGCCSHTGQAHILWLILYKHQTHKWEGSTEDAWHGQNGPPVIVLEKHCDQDWTQTTSQVHAAGQHRPPCSKLGGLEPLTNKEEGKKGKRSTFVNFLQYRQSQSMYISPSIVRLEILHIILLVGSGAKIGTCASFYAHLIKEGHCVMTTSPDYRIQLKRDGNWSQFTDTITIIKSTNWSNSLLTVL